MAFRNPDGFYSEVAEFEIKGRVPPRKVIKVLNDSLGMTWPELNRMVDAHDWDKAPFATYLGKKRDGDSTVYRYAIYRFER